MSTKLHNGLILRSHTLEQALCALKDLRERCNQAAETAMIRFCASRLAYEADLAANATLLIDGEVRKAPGLFDLLGDLREARIETQGRGVRQPNWDHTLEICLLPLDADVLALYYLENDHGYRQALLDAGFEDYHYQNSTDRPDDISEEEWAKREANWDRVLPPGRTPANEGLTYILVGWNDLIMAFPMNADRYLVSLPDEASRRKRVALRLLELEVMATHPDMGSFEAVKLIRRMLPDRQAEVALGQPAVDL